jgi:hypothetical protein
MHAATIRPGDDVAPVELDGLIEIGDGGGGIALVAASICVLPDLYLTVR